MNLLPYPVFLISQNGVSLLLSGVTYTVSVSRLSMVWLVMSLSLTILTLPFPRLQHVQLSYVSSLSMLPGTPGGPQPTPRQFWGLLTSLCRDAPSQVWCVIGDYNLTLAAVEISGSAAQLSPNRFPYLEFLYNSNGRDLWMTFDDHSVHSHYIFSCGIVSICHTSTVFLLLLSLFSFSFTS
jgi:hypothetical protein